MATFEINGANLRLRLRWVEKLEGGHGDVSVPLSSVAGVRAVGSAWGELRGIRAPGTGIPEVIAVGTRRGDYGKDFVAIHGQGPAVVVELAGAPYCRLVATVEDAESTAAMIRAGRPSPSRGPARTGRPPRIHVEVNTEDEPNAAERHRWNDPARTATWLDREPITAASTSALLGHLELIAGERMLDIGCGGGGLALAAARAVGSGGTVVGVDLSTPLVEVARRRTEAAGLDRVSFVVADAQLDRVSGGPFDVAASQFGVLFFDNPVAAFANVAAQLNPDGRLGFVCWQGVEENPWHVGATLQRFAPEDAQRRLTGPFSLADPDHAVAILEAAGWVSVVRTGYRRRLVVEPSALLRRDGGAVAGIPEAARGEAQRAIAAQLKPFSTSDGRYAVPLAFQVFTARRG